MFYKCRLITEEESAWVECDGCEGFCHDSHGVPCPDCNGEGGKWHEAIIIVCGDMPLLNKSGDKDPMLKDTKAVTKTSILIREHKVCGECRGKGWLCVKADCRELKCDHCLKDIYGNPTGAEPGTAGPWKVKYNAGEATTWK